MATERDYLEKQSDQELRGILVSYCMGVVDIPVNTAFFICSTLAKRDPTLPNPRELFRNFCRNYI